MLLPLVLQPLGPENCSMDLPFERKMSDLKFGRLLEDFVSLASSVAVYFEVEQTFCGITLINSSNNLMSLPYLP